MYQIYQVTMKTRNHRTTHRKIDRRKLAALRAQAQTFLYGLKPFAECVEVLNNVFAQVPHDPETTKALCLIKAALLYAATHQPKDFPALVEMVQRNHEIFHPERRVTIVCDLRELFRESAQRTTEMEPKN
jgi:hypothetical protein